MSTTNVISHVWPVTFVFEDDGLVPNNPLPFLVYKGVLPLQNGGEPAALFCFIFLYMVFAGPGTASLDGALFPRK